MLHSSGWLIDAAVSIRRRKKLIQHGEERRQGAETKSFFDRREEKVFGGVHFTPWRSSEALCCYQLRRED
jgi:hypothetical protein